MILAIGNKARGLEIHCDNVFLGVIQLPEALHAGLSLYLMLILLLLTSTFGSIVWISLYDEVAII